MTVGKTDEIKQELARKVENTKAGTKLKKSMNIADMIKVMEPQIKKALPEAYFSNVGKILLDRDTAISDQRINKKYER